MLFVAFLITQIPFCLWLAQTTGNTRKYNPCGEGISRNHIASFPNNVTKFINHSSSWPDGRATASMMDLVCENS